MEKIRQAVERAKGSGFADNSLQNQFTQPFVQPTFYPDAVVTSAPKFLGKEVALDVARLEKNKIIAHNVEDPRSKSFEMLRTQVLQTMDQKSWKLLGVSSPTAGCGKSVIAINLALSIARLENRRVLLVDFDLQKPQIAKYLGLKCDQGLMNILEGRADLSASVIQAVVGTKKISVLPCEKSTLNSSEWMASQSVSTLLQRIKRDFRDWIVILDLPPVLTGDDVITILPQIDCILFVAAMGTSTISDVKESSRHLESAPIVRVVLNKSSELPATYYSRYAEIPRRG